MAREHMERANERINQAKARQRALEKARREALARVGCEHCGASKDEIRGEQARLKAEFLARMELRAVNTNEAAAGLAAAAS